MSDVATGRAPPDETPLPSRAPITRDGIARDRAILLVLDGPQLGSVFPLHPSETSLGRDPHTHVRLDDDRVSGVHAKLIRGEDGVLIEDCASRGGTFVNGKRLHAQSPLVNGDRIRLGSSTVLQLCLLDELEERALRTLSELTLLDPLTRLYNRRYLDRRLESEFSFIRRHSMSLAVLMIDIDRFKAVNDTFGHQMGDVALKAVARSIERMVRPEDVVARLGGDEFIVIARAVSPRNAEILGHRLCRRVEALTLRRGDAMIAFTVSVGVALLAPGTACASLEAVMAAADRALYRAKSQGRNQSVTCTVPEDGTAPSVSPPRRRTLPPPR